MHVQRFGVLAVVAVVVLSGGAATAAPVGSTGPTADADPVVYDRLQDATVAFEDQNATDNTVTVESVTLNEDGYVAIHDDSYLDGDGDNATGSVIGVSEHLEAGTHQNVTVTLYEDVPGATFEDASPNGTQTLVAMPHMETTGDTSFDFVASDGADDGPYTTNDQPIVELASVTFGDAEADGETTETTNGETTTTEGETTTDGETTTTEGQPTENETATQAQGLVVESLDAPGYTTPDSTITVNATITNNGASDVDEDVAFRLEGGTVDLVEHQTVSVNAGESTNVTFEVDTTGAPEDEYIHGVTTYNSSEFTTIVVSNQSEVDFNEQETDGSTVTVEDVYVPEGGYVTIHDSTLQEGDALGSVVGTSEYLDAGYHSNVNVTLDEQLTESQTLIAMPHMETTGDTTYDFVTSEGADDGPYTVDGQPVVEAANVTVTGNATA